MQHSMQARELHELLSCVIRMYETSLDYPAETVYPGSRGERHFYEDDEDLLIHLIEVAHDVWRSRRYSRVATPYGIPSSDHLRWQTDNMDP